MDEIGTPEMWMLFKGHMVRQILRDEKLETRRIITYRGWAPDGNCKECGQHVEKIKKLTVPSSATIDGKPIIWMGKHQQHFISADRDKGYTVDCPYGQPGDQIWVRETFAFPVEFDHLPPRDVPEGTPVFYRANTDKDWETQSNGLLVGKWRSSIFMPRWASRITLVIREIKVEHIQDISRVSAELEGIEREWDGTANWFKNYLDPEGPMLKRQQIESFRSLWDSINADRGFSWDSNPYVWVIKFERLKT